MLEACEMKLDDTQEMFTHIDNDGVTRMFPIGNMRKFIMEYGPRCRDLIFTKGQLEQSHIDFLMKDAGI